MSIRSTIGFCKKCFKEDARQGIILGYLPQTDHILYYYEGTGQVKIATHAKFDEDFNDLTVDNLPLNSQKVLFLNGTCVPADNNKLTSSDLEFFVYLFSDKETAVIPILPNMSDTLFGFDLTDCKLSGYMYIKDVNDTMLSSAAK